MSIAELPFYHIPVMPGSGIINFNENVTFFSAKHECFFVEIQRVGMPGNSFYVIMKS